MRFKYRPKIIYCEPSRIKGEDHSRQDSSTKLLRHACYIGEKGKRVVGAGETERVKKSPDMKPEIMWMGVVHYRPW